LARVNAPRGRLDQVGKELLNEGTMAAEKPSIVAEVLVGSLTAVAFEEMVRAIHESAKGEGITWGTGALALIFSLTTIRFLVGNLLYLKRATENSTWFYDLLVIVAQAVALAFLGGLCVREESIQLRFSFFGVLCIVLVIDLCWTFAHWVKKRRSPQSGEASALQQPDNKQKGDPLTDWLILNSALLAVIGIFYVFCGAEMAYSCFGLAILLVANLLAFFIDHWILKKYGLI